MVDLERLVAIVVEEVAAAQRAGRAPSQCGCHAVLYECCPDRLRGVLDAGASRLGLHATGGKPGDVAGVDRSHAAQARRDAGRHRTALSRGGRVPLRHRVREPHLGRAGRTAAAGFTGRRLLGRRAFRSARRRPT